jgi:hypothetical protein
MTERLRVMQRQPRRISITLSHHVHETLLNRSEEEGRSVSNLCAFLLEEALVSDRKRETATANQLPAPSRAPSIGAYTPATTPSGNGALRIHDRS